MQTDPNLFSYWTVVKPFPCLVVGAVCGQLPILSLFHPSLKFLSSALSWRTRLGPLLYKPGNFGLKSSILSLEVTEESPPMREKPQMGGYSPFPSDGPQAAVETPEIAQELATNPVPMVEWGLDAARGKSLPPQPGMTLPGHGSHELWTKLRKLKKMGQEMDKGYPFWLPGHCLWHRALPFADFSLQKDYSVLLFFSVQRFFSQCCRGKRGQAVTYNFEPVCSRKGNTKII